MNGLCFFQKYCKQGYSRKTYHCITLRITKFVRREERLETPNNLNMVCKFLLLIYLVLPTAYYCFLMRSNKWVTTNSHIFGNQQLHSTNSKTDIVKATVPYANGTQIFFEEMKQSIQNQSFKSLRITYKSKTDINKGETADKFDSDDLLRTIQAKYVKIKSDIKMQIVYSYFRNDKTFNYPLHTAIDTLEPLFGVQPVKAAILNSKFSKVELAMNRYGGILTHTSSVSTNSSSRIDLADNNNNPPIEIDDPTYLQHDRKKKEMISIDEPFLQALKITTTSTSTSPAVRDERRSPSSPRARPRAGMADKLKQIQRFVEILDGLVFKSPLAAHIQSANYGNHKVYICMYVCMFIWLYMCVYVWLYGMNVFMFA